MFKLRTPWSLLLWVSVLFATVQGSARLSAEDLRPVCHGSLQGDVFQLTIANLTPTITNAISRTLSLEAAQWDVIATFVSTSAVYTWTETLSAPPQPAYYRVESVLPDDPYRVYFLRNPRVAQVTVDRFDVETRGYFDGYVSELETTGVLAIGKPLNLQNCQVTQNCPSMTRISLAVLRSLNIPGEEVRNGINGPWFASGHSSAVWPCISSVLAHGDNIYNALLLDTPVGEFLTPFSFYEEHLGTEPCAANRACVSRRHMAFNAIRYPTSYTRVRCCTPENYGYADCADYLDRNLGPFLTADELNAAAAQLEALCESE